MKQLVTGILLLIAISSLGQGSFFWSHSTTVPAITTNIITSITSTGAISGGNITSNGGGMISAKGVCWSTFANPTIADSKTNDGIGNEPFTSNITGLTIGKTYHVRAYATNPAGTSYGNDVTFTYLYHGAAYQGGLVFYIDETGNHGLVCASTDQSTGTVWGCSGVLLTGADGFSLGTGNQNTTDIITGCSSAGIAARICYDLSLNGYTDWFLPSEGELQQMYNNLKLNGLGNFADNDYWSSTQYNVSSAWTLNFTNGFNNYYFKTSSYNVRAVRAFSSPLLATTTPSSITSTSVISGGSISSDYGEAITARGVCWSTSTNPTIDDSKTNNGTGLGTFTSSITGLTANTTYHIRAYATNSVGTAYGEDVSFTTAVTSIGDTYEGGIVFYIDGTGQHGLVCASSDQSTGIKFDNYLITHATAIAVGTGQANTTTIVTVNGVGSYAAKLCDDLVLNGYSDWFLPSKDELNLMYTKLKVNGLGGFADAIYWSSSEHISASLYGWYQNFAIGSLGSNDKVWPYRVRAVRAF